MNSVTLGKKISNSPCERLRACGINIGVSISYNNIWDFVNCNILLERLPVNSSVLYWNDMINAIIKLSRRESVEHFQCSPGDRQIFLPNWGDLGFIIERILVGESIYYRIDISYLVASHFIQELRQSLIPLFRIIRLWDRL